MIWQFIVNPRAGRGGSAITAIRAGAEARDLEARFHESTSLEDLRAVVASAVEDGIVRFVAVGGDGTAHHVVDAALSVPDTPARMMLAVVPSGSGSDFVRTFGRGSETLDAGLDRLVDPQTYAIDIGLITGSFGVRHFINAANAGIAAASANMAGRLPSILGASRYGAAFWLTLGRFPGAHVEVRASRHRYSGDAINVVVANGQFFGGGMNVAPRASMVDGILDIQVFAGPRRNAFVVMPRLLVGSHLTHPAVRRYVGSEVSITCPDTWPIEADGELLGSGPVTISVLPGAIDLVI
jgi:diacylglycerol kinase (ATP)